MYLNGASIIGIIKELESRSIKSPSGKTKWCKRTIDTILSNEKYTGNVIAFKSYNSGYPDTKRIMNKGEKEQFEAIGCNPAIISEEQYKKVQEERVKRSNVIKTDDKVQRKNTHYSSKRSTIE